MEPGFGWELVSTTASQSNWCLVQPAAGTHIPILNVKKAGRKRRNDRWGLSRPPAGRSQLTLLFYTCSLPPLIPMGWSNLFSHSLFVNHPLAAAKVNQLLPPELAVQKTVIQSKEGKKMTEGESGWLGSMHGASCSRPEVRSAPQPAIPAVTSARSPGSPVACWGASPSRAEGDASHHLLVQLRGRPSKNTRGSWKYGRRPRVCHSNTPLPWKQRPSCSFELEGNCVRSAPQRRHPPVKPSEGKTASRPRGFPCCSLAVLLQPKYLG